MSAGCAKGSVKAVIGGRATCLRTGANCQSKFAAQYRKYGFLCSQGRLRKLAKPKPPANPVPPTPAIPNGPAPTKVVMPSATGLPSGTAAITLPATDAWEPNVGELTTTSDSVWVASGLFRIDPGHNTVSGPFTHATSQDIVAGEGSIWVSDYSNDVVRRFDQATGNQVAVVKLPGGSAPEGLVDANGSIWVANHHGGSISRIDPQTNKVLATIIVGPPGADGPQGIAAGLGSIWVGVSNQSAVVRIDPSTNKITAMIALPLSATPCGGIAVGVTAVWVTSCLETTTIAQIDPNTNKVTAILDVGGEVVQPAVDGDSVWFVAGGDPDNSPNADGYLIHLGADDHVQARIDVGPGFISGGTAVAFGSIWVNDFSHPRVLRIPQPN